MAADRSTENRHHATYVLERGVWRATCRVCRFEVTDSDRRRANGLFRNHIREVQSAVLDVREPEITDLTDTHTPTPELA
jgi:hypothetical protein